MSAFDSDNSILADVNECAYHVNEEWDETEEHDSYVVSMPKVIDQHHYQVRAE